MPYISVIIPVYNCEKYLMDAVNSIRQQPVKDMEIILVDDGSTDSSGEICFRLAEEDTNVKVFSQANKGASAARNTGLEHAVGEYVMFLDADDIWLSNKLERQLDFMEQHNIQFSCCDYEKIEADGTPLNKIVHMPKTITYNQLLRNTIIQTVGVIIDLNRVDRNLLVMPNVRRGQDSATWLQMLRNGVKFVGQNEVLAQYRRVPHSLSANKLSALKRTWYLYRGVEHLSVPKSVVCLIGWAYHASVKRIYIKNKKHQ